MNSLRSLSVALVVPAFDTGGLEQTVLNLHRAYRAAGVPSVILIEANNYGELARKVAREEVFIFNGNEEAFLSELFERRINLVHYHYSTFGLRELSRLGVRTVYTLHNIYTWLDDEAFAARAEQILEADDIVAVSRWVRDYFCFRAGVDGDRVSVIQNGIDLSGLRSAACAQTRNALGISQETFVFATVASLHRNKHHLVAIAAAERLALEGANLRLLLVGGGGDPQYASLVRDRMLASPANDKIQIVPQIPHEQMGAFYGEAVDAILLPSLQEGCSNVVLEGLATGRPMILTDVGNAREAEILSADVTVIPPAYQDVATLTPDMIIRLSEMDQTNNLDAMIVAMRNLIAAKRPRPATASQPDPSLLGAISAERMSASYFSLVVEGRPLLTWPMPERYA
ncbi:glycosyltransferase family 4 protein [Enterovirga sp. CN4-39]|uniref:glycosyltransferase family 4 protein n=1 Tax=Enterovirga sp. CN4-39 TaxID=3400910 RepID=UPI003C062F23